MSLTLESLKPCLQGVIPSSIFTCSADGVPNIAYLSQVHYIDDRHVAATMQFFNKTKANLLENPKCTLRVSDPETFLSYRLTARHLRSEDRGPLFDEVDARLSAIADHSGASDIFKLRAIEIFEVSGILSLDSETTPLPPGRSFDEHRPRLTVAALQQACERVNSAQTLDEVFDSILQAMDLDFGFRHSMILMADESSRRLLTIATRGYAQNGVGSEVKLGEGVIGRAAEMKVPRIYASLVREMRYARTAADSAREAGGTEDRTAIPLPGLSDARSQVAVPLVIRNDLLGVLFVESHKIFDFKETDEQLLRTLGSVLAMSIQSLQVVHRAEQDPVPAGSLPAKPAGEKMVFSFYAGDDCLFLNGEYLIRSLPARILWKLLKQREASDQREFSNRELRMDSFLQLPEVKDNLETRLILLRKRLEAKCPSVKIVSIGRGRFRLDVGGAYRLERID